MIGIRIVFFLILLVFSSQLLRKTTGKSLDNTTASGNNAKTSQSKSTDTSEKSTQSDEKSETTKNVDSGSVESVVEFIPSKPFQKGAIDPEAPMFGPAGRMIGQYPGAPGLSTNDNDYICAMWYGPKYYWSFTKLTCISMDDGTLSSREMNVTTAAISK